MINPPLSELNQIEINREKTFAWVRLRYEIYSSEPKLLCVVGDLIPFCIKFHPFIQFQRVGYPGYQTLPKKKFGRVWYPGYVWGSNKLDHLRDTVLIPWLKRFGISSCSSFAELISPFSLTVKHFWSRIRCKFKVDFLQTTDPAYRRSIPKAKFLFEAKRYDA